MSVKIFKSGTEIRFTDQTTTTSTMAAKDNSAIATTQRVMTLADTSTTLTSLQKNVSFRIPIARFYTTAATNATFTIPVAPTAAISGLTVKTSGYGDAGFLTACRNLPLTYSAVYVEILTSNIASGTALTTERNNFIAGTDITSGYSATVLAPTFRSIDVNIKATTMSSTTNPRVVCNTAPTTTNVPLSLTVVAPAGTTYFEIFGDVSYVA